MDYFDPTKRIYENELGVQQQAAWGRGRSGALEVTGVSGYGGVTVREYAGGSVCVDYECV